MTIIEIAQTWTDTNFNVMPTAGVERFKKAVAEKGATMEEVKEQLYAAADAIMESGEEAATGHNWADSVLTALLG